MPDLTLSALVVVGLTFVLAGFVKGVIGMGLPTVAVGALALVMAPVHAAALLVVPSLVTNVWQLLAGSRFLGLLRQLWTMMAGICVGTLAGSGLMAGENARLAVTALGVALVVYAIIGLSAVRFHVPPSWRPWLSPLVGAITGLVTAATGVFVIPAVPYLQALGYEKDELIQALGLSFTVSTLALAAGLAREGLIPTSLAGASLLALAPALAGMFAGQWLRNRVSPATFRLCFFVGLLALGLHLASRAVL